MRVETETVPAEHIERILAGTAEAYSFDAPFQAIVYDGDEPAGVLAGQHEEWPDGGHFLHLTTLYVRPEWHHLGLWRQLGEAMQHYCRAHALRAVTCAFKADDPPEVIAVARRWGFVRYHRDDHGLSWFVWFLPMEGA